MVQLVVLAICLWKDYDVYSTPTLDVTFVLGLYSITPCTHSVGISDCIVQRLERVVITEKFLLFCIHCSN